MPQKYKVFFNNNRVYITNKGTKSPNCSNQIVNPSPIEIGSAIKLLYASASKLELCFVFKDLSLGWKQFKKHFEVRKAAGGLVINKNNEILFIKRKGFWDLPKGHIEKDEKKKHAAIREVSEECGISQLKIVSELITTYHSYKVKSGMILKPSYWYLMNYTGHEPLIPQTEEGITDAKWVKKSKIPTLMDKAYPSIKDVVHAFIDADYSFSPEAK
ncbi:MAG: NUDIX domain-containing protein [Salinivirgaceae bacterium]|nr:NUDIX domain-containing protein [Salinivirgaceae bacterium]